MLGFSANLVHTAKVPEAQKRPVFGFLVHDQAAGFFSNQKTPTRGRWVGGWVRSQIWIWCEVQRLLGDTCPQGAPFFFMGGILCPPPPGGILCQAVWVGRDPPGGVFKRSLPGKHQIPYPLPVQVSQGTPRLSPHSRVWLNSVCSKAMAVPCAVSKELAES